MEIIKQHNFSVHVAMKYGIHCAVILENIHYWVEYNKANDKNFHDGYYWTYNSNKAFELLFPYMTSRQIRYSLDTLKKEGLILTANYNEGCNRTLWYTVTEKAIKLLNGVEESINSNFQNAPESISDDEKLIDLAENTPTNDCDVVSQSEENKSPEDNESILANGNMQNCQNDICNFVKSNYADLSNGNIQFCQIDLPNLSNHTNNKQQIINTNINLNIKEKEIHKEKEDPVQCVFDFWNTKDIIKCSELTPNLKAIIQHALKTYTVEEIMLYISRYDEALNDETFWSKHRWSLKSFLTQSNAMPDFKDGGQKWINYQDWKKRNQNKPPSNATKPNKLQPNATKPMEILGKLYASVKEKEMQNN